MSATSCVGWVRSLCVGLLLVGAVARPAAAQPISPGATAINASGVLEIVHEDFADHGRYLYFLEQADGSRIPLRFSGKPPSNLSTGDRVRVHGRPAGGSLLVTSGSTGIVGMARTTSSSPPLPNALGAQTTLVILVNFQDAPSNQPYTVADAQNVVFGTASSFFLENSYQQTWLTGDVAGWFTIAQSSTACDTAAIANDAQAAATAAGFNLSSYAHLVYAFPQNNACGFAGSSFIGGSPSQSWLNGDSLDLHVIDHELGHALGLWHSHLLDCGTGATIGSSCSVLEYGDIIDTMGAPQTPSPHYDAFQKERLGWLNYGTSPAITTVQSGGTYSIATYEQPGSGPNALKILKSIDPVTGAKTWFYVEARQATGFDAFIANEPSQNETGGVLVHLGTDGDGNSGDLLDMTPATPTYYWWFDPALVAGQSVTDSADGVTLTADTVTSTGATVTVQYGAAVAVATSQQSYSPGQTVSAMATATSGGSPVAKASVSFTITKANGAVVTGTATTGSNGVATYNLKLKRNDPAGTYVVSVATTIKGTPCNAKANFSVQ